MGEVGVGFFLSGGWSWRQEENLKIGIERIWKVEFLS